MLIKLTELSAEISYVRPDAIVCMQRLPELKPEATGDLTMKGYPARTAVETRSGRLLMCVETPEQILTASPVNQTVMSKVELLDRLRKAAAVADTESAHEDADQALVDYINDPEVTAAWTAVAKWYG